MEQPLELSRPDWDEIYSALESKARGLHNGTFGGPEPEDENWITHIRRIMDTIGPGGEHAVKRGVKGDPTR